MVNILEYILHVDKHLDTLITAIAARGTLDIVVLLCVLTLAAILGDTFNYWIGHTLGPQVFKRDSGWLRKEHLLKTRAFFMKYGAKAVVLGRFIPIIRTFAPLVAGIGAMSYRTFLFYNILGGILWVGFFTMLGYLFGNIPIVKENFTLVVLVIIFLSLLPLAWELMMHHRHGKSAPQ
jgi:membrane-associated protein